MGVKSTLIGDDSGHDFLVGMAVVTALLAVFVVGFEAGGAAAGESVDPDWIAISALTAVTVLGGVVIHRRED